MFEVHIPGLSTLTVIVSPGRPLFLLGRNGTGKSALMQSFRQQLALRSVYLPGNRTSVFDGEGLTMPPSGRNQYVTNLVGWDNDPGSRWRLYTGNQRNDKAIHDLIAAEVDYIFEITSQISDGIVEDNVRKLQSRQSPINQINKILEQANIGVRFSLINGDVFANKDGNTYSFARMSDGERIALVLLAEVVSATYGLAIIIDEPELHLHRAIIIPLMKSIINLRSDCSFIISSHELDLPSEIPGAQVCIVRSAAWTKDHLVSSWEADLVDVHAIPESLRTDLLGSRRKILFIEGGIESLDKPMYAILFPESSVRPRNGCREVVRAVEGLRSTIELHHAEAYGLVDGDGMSQTQAVDYQTRGIFALPVYAVESLYYAPELLKAVADRQAETANVGTLDRQIASQQYLKDAITNALAVLKLDGKLEYLASRVAERQLRDKLLASVPKREDMVSGNLPEINISVSSPYHSELEKIRSLMAKNDLHGVIARYPVRETGALDRIARALRFVNRTDYESAALARLSSDDELRNILRDKLQPLSSVLET